MATLFGKVVGYRPNVAIKPAVNATLILMRTQFVCFSYMSGVLLISWKDRVLRLSGWVGTSLREQYEKLLTVYSNWSSSRYVVRMHITLLVHMCPLVLEF